MFVPEVPDALMESKTLYSVLPITCLHPSMYSVPHDSVSLALLLVIAVNKRRQY